jgi:hypothetical protein
MTNEFLTQGKRFFNHEGHEEHEAIIIFGSEVWMKCWKKIYIRNFGILFGNIF